MLPEYPVAVPQCQPGAANDDDGLEKSIAAGANRSHLTPCYHVLYEASARKPLVRVSNRKSFRS